MIFSFGFMFNLCPTCENSVEWARFIYYTPFVIIFQLGWASTQISHLSLLPQLSSCENERVALNAIRYAFTVMSNLFVYTIGKDTLFQISRSILQVEKIPVHQNYNKNRISYFDCLDHRTLLLN